MTKRAFRTVFPALILAILLIAAIPVWHTYEATTRLAEAAHDEVVTFPDTNLEAAIRETIGKPEGDIYTSDLGGLTLIDASERNIADLTGLEYCIDLTTLFLNENHISTISPLSNLTNLDLLHLGGNQVTDISPLTNLTSLSYLTLVSNQISDISPLSNLIHLTHLHLAKNQISDISPMTNLTSLSYLDLWDNNIADLSPLVANGGLGNGDYIFLMGNQLSNFSLDTLIPQLVGRGVIVYYDPNHIPNQPSNISPSDGAADISLTPTLVSSDFSDPDEGDTHAASQWQISAISGDYSSPVFDSGTDSSNLTQITIPAGILHSVTTYYWHVRHQDSNDAWSSWSTETSFDIPPVVTLGSTSTSPTNTSPISVTATFSEAVTGFELSDITVGNGTAGNFTAVSTSVYTCSVTPGADGEVTVNIAAGVAQDAVGNNNTAATELSITYDGTAPTAAMTYSVAGPYKAGDSVTITATFSEDMADSPIVCIAISEGQTLPATNMVEMDSTHYIYEYTVGSGDGTATVSLSTGTDLAGNPITSTPTSGATFTVDNTAPTAAITYAPAGHYMPGESVTITATFSEAMADSPVVQIAISGAETLVATDMTKTDSTHYTYIYTVGSDDGTATVSLYTGTDLVGNEITSEPTSGATFTMGKSSSLWIVLASVLGGLGVLVVVSGVIVIKRRGRSAPTGDITN